MLEKLNILWKDYIVQTLILLGYLLHLLKINFPEKLSIPTALSILISLSNCSARSSVTFENLDLDGSSPKVS